MSSASSHLALTTHWLSRPFRPRPLYQHTELLRTVPQDGTPLSWGFPFSERDKAPACITKHHLLVQSCMLRGTECQSCHCVYCVASLKIAKPREARTLKLNMPLRQVPQSSADAVSFLLSKSINKTFMFELSPQQDLGHHFTSNEGMNGMVFLLQLPRSPMVDTAGVSVARQASDSSTATRPYETIHIYGFQSL